MKNQSRYLIIIFNKKWPYTVKSITIQSHLSSKFTCSELTGYSQARQIKSFASLLAYN